MRGKKWNGGGLRLFLAVILMMTAVPGPVSLYAEENGPRDEKDYIVKFREGEAALMEEAQEPFDVVDGTELRKLLREDALEWYEEDGWAVLLDEEPTEPLSGSDSDYYDADQQWNLSLINAEPAFRQNHLGQGIRVGVVDSGVSPHSDFGGRLLAGHNYMQDAQGDPVKEADTVDEYGHGTRVAGLIAAAGDSGYIGAAPGAEIVPLKCTDGKSVKISAICRAIYGAIDEYGCDVLNLSLGVQTEYESLREAIAYAEDKHVVVISAVGNGGSSAQYYPASYETVIGVGSVDRNGDLYSRSNHNLSVFLTAPGVAVRSTDVRGSYSESTGCSFAIPQVSAAAAVMLGIDPSLTPEEIMEILSETAVDRGMEGYDEYYGYGILNLGGCVAALKGSDGEDPGEILPDPQQPVSPGEAEEWNDPEDVTDPEDLSGQEHPSEPSGTTDPVPSGTDDPPTVPGTPEPTAPEDSPSSSSPSGTSSPSDSSGSSGSPGSVRPAQPSVNPVPVSPPVDPSPEDSQNQQGYRQCPKDQSCPLSGFSDLDRDAWYHDGIHYVLENRIMNGLGKGQFGPGDSTSRAMIVTMLWRMEGSPQADGNATFKDVSHGQWYTESVRWAASEGLVNGYSRTAFGPDDKVSREQLAAILWRYEAYKRAGDKMPDYPDLLGNYTDTEQISSWALDAMRWTTGCGLMQGMTETTLSPKTSAVRAQVATMLMRYSSIVA